MTIARRRLARDLTWLRDEAGHSPEQVATHLGWSRPKVSRIETGKTVPKAAEVEALLDLYRCDAAQAAATIELARDARSRGWWTAFNDVLSGPFIGMEDGAASIRAWETQFIPGLLQTEAYARAVIAATHPDAPESVHRRVQARMARRGLLERDRAPGFHAVMDEAVLRRPVGGPEVMEPQLLRLLTMSRRPHITVQILPFAAGAHAGLIGPFILLDFGDPDLDIAYADGQDDETYREMPDQLAKLTLIWDQLVAIAASPDESRSLIAELTGT